jgi:peptidoglycan/LPS O-acetylase OafA/YrhL
MVIIFHYSEIIKINFWLLKVGVTGVDLFFMISGFVIMASILKNNWFDFLKKRIFRLYPAFFIITLIIYFIVNKYYYPKLFFSFQQLLINLCFFPNQFGFNYFDGVCWSLTVEIQFYLFITLFETN